MNNTQSLINKILGKDNIASAEYQEYSYVKKYKIVVFAPSFNTDEIAFAMARAGAGRIGEYSDCSFRVHGTGTFKGSSKTKPFVGTKGKLERVNEIRLEMICDRASLDNAIENMLSVHPYEEPAYEIYPVMVREKKKEGEQTLRVRLKKQIAVTEILKKINRKVEPEKIPSKYSKLKIKNVVIYNSINTVVTASSVKGKTLHLTKNKNGTFNISLK